MKGARIVAKEALKIGLSENVVSYVVEDKDTVVAMNHFLDDQRILVNFKIKKYKKKWNK